MVIDVRRFELHRDEDISGVSGTGIVAEGLASSDGVAVLRWLGETPSTVVHDGGMQAVEAIHGHGGATRIVYIDDEELAIDRQLIERCAVVLHDVRSSTPWQHTSDYDKDTERMAAGAMLDYLQDERKSDG